MRQFGEGVVKEVELEDMCFEHVQTVADLVFHNLHIGFIESGSPYIVFVGEVSEQVSRACTAIPNNIFVLPILSQYFGEVFLRFFDPNTRCEERAFTLSDVLRDEQVSSFEYISPVFFFGWSLVFRPELGVRFSLVFEVCSCFDFEVKVFVLFVDEVVMVGAE